MSWIRPFVIGNCLGAGLFAAAWFISVLIALHDFCNPTCNFGAY